MVNTEHITETKPMSRDQWNSITHKVNMGQRCGEFYVTVASNDKGNPIHIHISAGKLKTGTCAMTHLGVIEELVNVKLRHGSPAHKIADKFLLGVVCEEDQSHIQGRSRSCHEAIGKLLMEGSNV